MFNDEKIVQYTMLVTNTIYSFTVRFAQEQNSQVGNILFHSQVWIGGKDESA